MLRASQAGALILLWVLALTPSTVLAKYEGYSDTLSWNIAEMDWADMSGLPRDVEFTAPVTASYNLGYGTTMLGLNLRSGAEGNQYYLAIASCVNGQLTVYDYMGPFEAPVQWDSGPYHLAAGLPDRRLAVWLTAPGEYPRLSYLAFDYQPSTTFTCTVVPPSGLANNWPAWQIDAAYLTDNRTLAVGAYDGLGRFLAGPELLDTVYSVNSIVMRKLALGDIWTTSVVYTNSKGLYHAWYDETKGWQSERLADNRLDNIRLWFSPEPAPPLGLVLYVDGADAYTNPTLHALTISNASGRYITVRWGHSTTVWPEYRQRPTAFIDSVSSIWPLIAQASDGNIQLAYHQPDPTGKRHMPFNSVELHYGVRHGSGTGTVEAYPITGISGTAHWQSGNPVIFWVQLGGGRRPGEGTLFRLSYEPEEE